MTYTLPFNKATRMRALIVGVLALGLLSVQVGRGTLAYFTTTVNSSANVFTAGKLIFNMADDVNAGTITARTASITFANMKPGDTVYAPIEIENVGTLNAVYGLTYTTTTTGTNLAPGLMLAISGTGNTSGAGGGVDLTVGTKGTGAKNNTDCSAGAGNFGSSAKWPEIVQSTTAMVAAGATIHTLVQETANAAASATGIGIPSASGLGKDILCLQVIFNDPNSGDNTYNPGTITDTTVTFTFDARVNGAAVINAI